MILLVSEVLQQFSLAAIWGLLALDKILIAQPYRKSSNDFSSTKADTLISCRSSVNMI
jgi:hypothetical protein